jgi:ferredoxin
MAEAFRILKRKRTPAAYCGKIPAVENYIPLFGSPSEEKVTSRTRIQSKATQEASRCVLERRTNTIFTFRPGSAFVSLLFSLGAKIFYSWFRVTSECNGCGICEKVCPVSAIVMRNNKPVITKKCEHCQGCINWCPKKAILFGTIKPETVRYHHPEISLADMSR